MVRRMTRVAGLVLVLTCLPFVLSGLGLFLYWFAALSCPPTAPVCRFGPPAAPFLIGGLLGAVGVVHVVVGIGIMRGGRRAQLLGLIVSVIGAASAAFVGFTAFKPLAYGFDAAGNPIPLYSWQSIAFAAAFIPYAFAALVLFVDIRQRRAQI